MRFTVDRLDHVVLTVSDIELAAAWYQRVLGMERDAFGADNRTALRFGGQKIDLREAPNLAQNVAHNRQSARADFCFVTAVGPEDVVGHLHSCGVVIERGPTHGTGALGPVTCVTCRDPDGNVIEIASYLE